MRQERLSYKWQLTWTSDSTHSQKIAVSLGTNWSWLQLEKNCEYSVHNTRQQMLHLGWRRWYWYLLEETLDEKTERDHEEAYVVIVSWICIAPYRAASEPDVSFEWFHSVFWRPLFLTMRIIVLSKNWIKLFLREVVQQNVLLLRPTGPKCGNDSYSPPRRQKCFNNTVQPARLLSSSLSEKYCVAYGKIRT